MTKDEFDNTLGAMRHFMRELGQRITVLEQASSDYISYKEVMDDVVKAKLFWSGEPAVVITEVDFNRLKSRE